MTKGEIIILMAFLVYWSASTISYTKLLKKYKSIIEKVSNDESDN